MLQGETYETSNGALEILEYTSSSRVKVRFLLTGYIRYAEAGAIRKGLVKDVYHPSVRGVGFMGEGKYLSKKKGTETEAYSAWSRMITRCYCPSYTSKNPTYKETVVCEEWHNFQIFAEWFYTNHIAGMSLDKDKLGDGTLYSPSTCSFISHKENSQLANSKGVSLVHTNGAVVHSPSQTQAAIDTNMSRCSISRLVSGKYTTIKGWSLLH